MALQYGMERIGHGVTRVPNLEGWAIGEWPSDGGGLQLQQPDGELFVYERCEVPPSWIAAAERTEWVLVLHGPNLGLRVPAGGPEADRQRSSELLEARTQGLVTGGLMRWGRMRTP